MDTSMAPNIETGTKRQRPQAEPEVAKANADAAKTAKTPKASTKTETTNVGTGPGVIATLVELLKNGGGTSAELYAKLAERFPDRATETGGMRITVSVQLNKLKTKHNIVKKEVKGRGDVYSIARSKKAAAADANANA